MYKLCYPKEFADQCRRKAENSFYSIINKESFLNNNVLALPFHQEFVPLTRLLRNINIQVVFKYEHTIKTSLIKNSPQSKAGCVYSIPCKACNVKYIGQTGKILSDRLKQHKYSVRTAQVSSGIFKHVEQNNHCINWKEAKEIYKSNSVIERLIVESVLIKSNETMNLNDGLYKIDNVLFNILLKDEKIKKALQICVTGNIAPPTPMAIPMRPDLRPPVNPP